ncbi:MAG: alpha/beta hydrolase [Anaerolineae bacterium]|nr:alpha/beta hydrolase [Anaerolineae bacterium]MCA9888435.1 alpha/beta hydrolase [Anaerolineae bacterium]MCA9893129.1 alpha/beta hydrolase [Anaerolineae bacterium]MCB9458901.1 alpha/beta hydrolase [Anaerolineaceae bacterium]
MPTLVTDRGIVHYEVYGRGRPVILLHGWLGSWALWRDTIEELGKEFRTYAIDFYGYGDSTEHTGDFSVSNHVELVNQFMEKLGIVKAPLVGHSMGGTVSLAVAARYPEKVVKVAVIGSPIEGQSLNPLLKMVGYKGIAQLAYKTPFVLPITIYLLTHLGSRNSGRIHRMVREDASKVSLNAFFQSIGTLRDTDLSDDLHDLEMPILGCYGKSDIIVSPKQGKVLCDVAATAREEWFSQSGHFPMMDEQEKFLKTLTEFLKQDVPTQARQQSVQQRTPDAPVPST